MSLTLIAAMTWPERVIGAGNAIPWRLGADLRRFKELTLGHPVIMGRRTWESLPFKLPGRTNMVLSASFNVLLKADLEAKGVRRKPEKMADLWAGSLDHALEQAKLRPGGSEVFIIGGAQVYAQTLPFADRLALTLIHHPFGGDARFPEWNEREWVEASREPGHHDGDPAFDYEFLDLKRSQPQGAA